MMGSAETRDARCPPGREGAYAALGEAGYTTVTASGDALQMAVFIRRAIAFYGGVVLEEEALHQFAQEQCANPSNYEGLLEYLDRCPWISWPGQMPFTVPGLQRTVSTHSASPTAAGAGSSDDVQFEPSAPPPEKMCDADTAMDVDASCEMPEPSCAQAVQNEVHMNSAQLCSTPFEDLGPLVVTAPPLRPHHIFNSRPFYLVLRNPRDPSRGLVLCSNTNRTVVSQTGHGILQELRAAGPDLVSALAEPAVYDALNHDPALLAAVTASCEEGDSGLSQLLGNFSSNSTVPMTCAGCAAASSEATMPPEEVHPEEETGECPICFEDIHAGEAAMRCAGEGGQHHYFHAHCLQQWIRSSGSGRGATCPICRGRLQFNGQRLEQFLNDESSAGLNDEERTLLQEIADGLRGRNGWSDMSNIERAAHVGGLMAAAGFGFMLGYSGSHNAERATMEIMHHCEVPAQHQVAQGVGWVAGLLARIIREATREKGDSRRRR